MSLQPVIFLVAGGTGGHVFPAEALGAALIKAGFNVYLLTDERGRNFIHYFGENHIYIISSETLNRKNPLRWPWLFYRLLKGLWQSVRHIRTHRPCLVVGFGGYPSLPPMVGAILMGCPTLIHEQNVVMGRANKALAPYVDKIAVGAPALKMRSDTTLANKMIVTGNPIRERILAASHIAYRPSQLDETFSLLVFGGSQGATFFSQIMPQAFALLDQSSRDRLSVVQQARGSDADNLQQAYHILGIKANIQPFFENIADHMAQAHLIIARSGASTVTEVSAIGRPALFVPYPGALDHDQLQNARILEASGGAVLMQQEQITPKLLASFIREALSSPEKMAAMAQKMRQMGYTDATEKLVDTVEALINKRINSVT